MKPTALFMLPAVTTFPAAPRTSGSRGAGATTDCAASMGELPPDWLGERVKP